MIQRVSIKAIGVVALSIVVVWLWTASTPQKDGTQLLVSSIKGVADVKAAELTTTDSVPSGLYPLNTQLDDALAKQLETALMLMKNKQIDPAVKAFKSIIKAQPQAIEPYINLASLYARNKQITLARETLLAGIKVNQNTSVMFDSLQQIYAAQASLAYQRALKIDTLDDQSLAVTLPTINSLAVAKSNDVDSELKNALDKEIATLRQRLESTTQQQAALTSTLQAERDSKALLEKTNSDLLSRSANLAVSHQAQTNLQTQLDQVNEVLVESDRMHEQAITKLRLEFDAALAAQRNESALELAALKQSNLIAAAHAPIIKEPDSFAKPVLVQDQSKQNTDIAIELVKSWANSWATQNVASYVEHYADDFAPSSGLSHKQWREQRRVRLMNKTFINVDVSQFEVVDREGVFSVTFSQHYQSNNVDDRIMKKLTFRKLSNHWAKAKIITEAIVTQ